MTGERKVAIIFLLPTEFIFIILTVDIICWLNQNMTKKYLNDENLDFLKDTKNTQVHPEQKIIPTKKRKRKGLILFLSIFAFVLSSFLYVQASASPISQGLKTFPCIESIKNLISPDEELLIGEDQDIINILLIGMGGEGHDGAYLADTIMLIRFKPSTKQVALISFPRDLAINLPGYGWRKINNANAYGGPELMASVLGDMIGEKIPYYVMVDFNGFASIIDDLGGLDVYVERSFTDNEYPAADYEFQTISFKKGMQHMDGATALIFARSRHGNNGEGSDFARSARQQKILMALKDKITSVNTFLNPTKLITLYNNLSKYIETNIDPPAIVRLAQLAQGTRESNIQSHIIIDGPNGLLEPTIGENGAYLLIPKEGLGNYTSIRNMVATIFDQIENESDPEYIKAEPEQVNSDRQQTSSTDVIDNEPEQVKVIILNGTTIPGYAAALGSLLAKENFTVVKAANHFDQSLNRTEVYRLNKKAKAAREYLEDLLKFDLKKKLSDDLEDYLKQIDPDNTELDFVIILGLDNQNIINY